MVYGEDCSAFLEVLPQSHRKQSFDDRTVLQLLGLPPRYFHFLLGLFGALPLLGSSAGIHALPPGTCANLVTRRFRPACMSYEDVVGER